MYADVQVTLLAVEAVHCETLLGEVLAAHGTSHIPGLVLVRQRVPAIVVVVTVLVTLVPLTITSHIAGLVKVGVLRDGYRFVGLLGYRFKFEIRIREGEIKEEEVGHELLLG
eukprot:Mycagemm_TRINITY_DN10270_c0_g3::TRINITY_DN10270_c0_g3_i1::g.4000::m.4000 type:complete len:112 gc:universal TRINITY_DN10270_c0_g3_i1:459-124(-)